MIAALRRLPATMRILLWFLPALLFLAGCSVSSSQSSSPVAKAKVVVPSTRTAPPGQAPTQIGADVNQQTISPKVPVPKNDNLLQVINANLDLNQSEDQILVLKNKNKADSPIRIAVVDFDNVRNEYVISWQHATLATNIRSFTVKTEDIIGDHNLEIVCTGINAKGEQTLNIFRKTHPPRGVNLYYTQIFGIAVKGKIQIERHQRSQAYKLGQKNGTSFSVVTLARNPNGKHIGDLIKRTYNWKYQTNTYVETSEQKIPGKQIEDRRLHKLYTAGAAAFESFLSGPWFKASGPQTSDVAPDPTASTPDSAHTLLFFDPKEKRITFYSGDIMEVYYWENSYRTLYNQLVISGYNELVHYIKAQISIAVGSVDKIQVYSPDEWAGTYQRLSKSMQQSLIKRPNPPYTPPKLAGVYTSPSGARLAFHSDRFTLEESGSKRSGGYSVFNYGVPVMELRFVDKSGMLSQTKSYKLSYSQEKSKQQIVRKLTLTPGRLGVHGFVATGANPLHYRQVDLLQKKKDTASSKKQ